MSLIGALALLQAAGYNIATAVAHATATLGSWLVSVIQLLRIKAAQTVLNPAVKPRNQLSPAAAGAGLGVPTPFEMDMGGTAVPLGPLVDAVAEKDQEQLQPLQPPQQQQEEQQEEEGRRKVQGEKEGHEGLVAVPQKSEGEEEWGEVVLDQQEGVEEDWGEGGMMKGGEGEGQASEEAPLTLGATPAAGGVGRSMQVALHGEMVKMFALVLPSANSDHQIGQLPHHPGTIFYTAI